MKVKYLNMAAPQTITIAEEEISLENLGDDMVAGKTLYTLVSVGTEFNGIYMNALNTNYPRKFGYAAVFQVEYIGKNVVGIEVGDIVFTKAQHKSYQIDNYRNVVKIPENVLPEHAIFSRLAGVSMASLKLTKIPSGEKVLVTGLGAVGFMAMQIYSNLGYEVIGVEPNEHRRNLMKKLGFTVFESVPFTNEKYNKKIALALECSGIESAVLDCCNIVRPRGEVSLVGVPWKKYCDISSQEILHTIFYKYVTVYSGWECDLPRENSGYVYVSENQNYRTCLRFMEAGKMNFEDSYLIKPYTQAAQVFEDIKNKKADQVFTIFSWNAE
jgi:threonine dehydrogenase-like Zn-dependent dehydrogenase